MPSPKPKKPAPKPPRPTSKLLVPAPAQLVGGTLTAQRARYLEARGMGMVPLRAAEYAGYANPESYAYTLEADPGIKEVLARVQAQNAGLSKMTRKKVMDIALEAIDMARTLQDPTAMLRGVQEINRMCGFYAPEKKSIELSAAKEKARGELALMSESDLIELAGGFKGVLEGEFEVVDDGAPAE
ncbi:MAG: hypothetical protein ACREXU_19505 [Gammaproteobacteria bacterium]